LADIFLSYNREDLAVARRFAQAFERAGLTVWWDQTLDPGEAYDHVTEKALKQAGAVVVLWSPRSVESRWVRAEATLAERNRTLVPVMIESCERPIMFELTQTSDLAGWKGDASDPRWQDFLASVQRTLARAPREPQRADVSAPPVAPAAARPDRTGVASNRKWIIGAGLGLAAVLVAATFFVVIRGPEPPATTASAQAGVARSERPRIAILPLQNLSPDPSHAFFADGLHEEILTALTNSGAALDVISRTTMLTYRDQRKAVPALAQELDADYVLEGSVRREGDEVRLTLQLIDANADRHIWSENFDRKLVNAMTLQSEVAAAVASQLSVQFAPGAALATAPPTRDPVAYDLYLEAQLARRLTSGGTSPSEGERIANLYAAAIARDPDFGLAYLGRAAMGPVARGSLDMPAWIQRSDQDLAAARRMLGDDPRIALLEAMNRTGGPFQDPESVLALFDAAEAKGLKDPEYLSQKATVLVFLGRIDEAVALRQRLVSLDPANPQLLLGLAADLNLARRPQESLVVIDRMIRQLPPELRPVWEGFRSSTIYAFTGDRSQFSAFLPAGDLPRLFDAALFEVTALDRLRAGGEFAEILGRLKKFPGPLLPSNGIFESYNLGLPPPPVARARGWTRLLMGDVQAARDDGREVLSMDSLARDPLDGEELDWLATLRRAEGHLFSGDPDRAIALAREGLSLMPRSRNALYAAYAAAMAAAILAWSGERDEAAALLEQLADDVPGLAPANITRDPLYTQPLAGNARFQALSERLEAQMAATTL
jgi:TolB-like protein